MGTTYTPMGNRDREWYANRQGPAAGEYQCVDSGLGVPQSDGIVMTGGPVESHTPPRTKTPITVVLVSVIILCLLHVLLGLVAVAVGVTASIKAEVWLAHTVSPIWSGVFVSTVRIHFETMFIIFHFIIPLYIPIVFND